MGRIETLTSSSSTSVMDIDPRSSTWNSLCPSFLDSKRNRIHLQDESSGHVIGSPPPAGPPKILWDDNFPVEVPNAKPHEADSTNVPGDKETVEASELSLRVQDIRLQPPQPMIICETVEDESEDTSEMVSSDAVSLSVPPVDVTNEKKRPPMSAPY